MLSSIRGAVSQTCRQSCRTMSSSTKPFKLYGFPLSQPFRSVLLLCQTNDIKYDMVLIDALKGQNLKPEYRAIHPAGLVPAIEEDGLGVLGESSAILVYLAETRQLTHWYPTDPIVKAKVNFWMSWHHGNTRLCTSGILRNTMFPPRDGSGPAVVAAAQKTLKGSLTYLESQLKVTKFVVAGDKPTIADLMLLTEIDQTHELGYIDFTAYPSIVRWMGDMAAALPTYQAVFEPVKVVAAALAAKAAAAAAK